MPQQRPSRLSTVLLLLIVLGLLAYLFTQSSPRGPSRADRGQPHRRQPGERGPQRPESCGTLGVACASTYFAAWHPPAEGACFTHTHNGNVLPDPACTPGGINPSVTEATLRDRSFSTRCDRNCATSEAEKHVAYRWYAIAQPHGNSGENQVCELDHLVPLELGGADGMGNLWPECGPDGATLNERQFKRKDLVENYLAEAVRAGRMPLAEAQRGIAEDWTRYLAAATR